MERCLVTSSAIPLKFHHLPTSIQPNNHQTLAFASSNLGISQPLRGIRDGVFRRAVTFKPRSVSLCTRAVLAETQYSKVGAQSTGPIPANQLLGVVQKAAETGAEVVMDAVNKPRKISYKGLTDLVTEQNE